MRTAHLISAIALSAIAATAQASLINRPANIVPANPIVNGDFEQSNVPSSAYAYAEISNPIALNAPGWSFTGTSGVANHSWAWYGAAAESSVAFLQSAAGTPEPTISQVINVLVPNLAFSFDLAQRPGNFESVRILLDGLDLTPDLLTPADFNWTRYTVTAYDIQPGNHTLSFVGANPTQSSDSTVFIDNVSAVSVPEPGSLALVALAGAAALAVRRQRKAG